MDATSKNGDVWTGERDGDWWQYRDAGGNLYGSKEVPVYYIRMNNACLDVAPDGKPVIVPRNTVCHLCKGTGTTDGALGFYGQGPCPRCSIDPRA